MIHKTYYVVHVPYMGDRLFTQLSAAKSYYLKMRHKNYNASIERLGNV